MFPSSYIHLFLPETCSHCVHCESSPVLEDEDTGPLASGSRKPREGDRQTKGNLNTKWQLPCLRSAYGAGAINPAWGHCGYLENERAYFTHSPFCLPDPWPVLQLSYGGDLVLWWGMSEREGVGSAREGDQVTPLSCSPWASQQCETSPNMPSTVQIGHW